MRSLAEPKAGPRLFSAPGVRLSFGMTPGTVTVDYDPERSVIRVHALDAEDPAAVVAEIKSRYEAPLKEALGC